MNGSALGDNVMNTSRHPFFLPTAIILLSGSFSLSCVRNAPVAPEPPPPPPPGESVSSASAPPSVPDLDLPESPTQSNSSPPPVTSPIIPPEDDFTARDLEELNRNSPLRPVFFGYDSSTLDADGRSILEDNSEILLNQPTWVITIEGHCDERGTPEYNLALGERRALAAREYLLERGLSPERLRTVSYGKEFPFNGGDNERAWSQNRRAHFVITAR